MPRPLHKVTTADLLGSAPDDGKRRKTMRLNQFVADTVSPAWHARLDALWDDQIKPLHIKIRKSRCVWAYRARVGPKAAQTDITIGDVREITAARIRELVDEVIRPHLSRKEDPRNQLAIALYGGPIVDTPPEIDGWTFEDMVRKFLARKRELSGERSEAEYRSVFHRPEFKTIWKKMARDVASSDVAEIRDGIKTAISVGRAITTIRYLSGMYRWAGGEPHSKLPAGYNPTKGVNLPELPPPSAPTTDERRFLSPPEIRLTLQAIARTEMAFSIRLALLVGIVSGHRRGALIQTKAEHICYTDEYGWHWQAPAAIMKARREHVIPLPPLALHLIDVARRHAARNNSVWLFPSERNSYRGMSRDKHINEGAINGTIMRMLAPDPARSPPSKRASKKKQQYKTHGELNRLGVSEWSLHDLRSTLTTNLMPVGVQEWHVSLLLAHSIRGTDHSQSRVTSKFYNLYKYYNEKRVALQRWCDLLEDCGLSVAYIDEAEATEILTWENRRTRQESAGAKAENTSGVLG